MLRVEGLVRRFGGVLAVDHFDLSIAEGEIRGLIGPNGAGKTTTFNVISGFYRPTAGRILYRGESITGLPMHRIAAKGLIRTFQHATLFLEMQVFENVLIGCHLQNRPDPVSWLLRKAHRKSDENHERVKEILDFFGLYKQRHSLAAELPYGAQRALGMAVALAARPQMLMLDEPFAGMNPEETRSVMGLVASLRERGITILLVEHDMQAVMGLCDFITVMNFGQRLKEGKPEEIRTDPAVVKAYLGSSYNAA